MRLFSLGFLIGVLLLQNFSNLPSKKWIWILITSALIIIKLSKRLRIITAIACGFAWALWYAHSQLAWVIPTNLEGKNVIATGYIASIPDNSHEIISFLFSVKQIQYEGQIIPAKGLLKLSWRSKNENNSKMHLHVGDKWNLTVRLKKIHGLMNPGSFDYEAWAFQGNIRAQGYIIDKAQNKLISSHWTHYSLDRIREFLKLKIEKNLPQSNTSPWIVALSLGERHGISQENWDILRNTGTNHLMAIAGLHIGFMSGFAFAIASWLWRRSPKLILTLPAQYIGAIAALIMAFIYSALAGFSIPTQRACIMLMVFLITLLLKRKIVSWQAWATALLLVLIINPLSPIAESFWLSFGAVALILFGSSGRLAPKGIWWKWGRIQWVIAVGLIPFSIWLFQQFSLVSFLANSITIPLVGFIIVPLCLLGLFLLLFSSTIGGFILILADKILNFTWILLTWFSNLDWASWYQVIPHYYALLLGCIGVVILLLPIGIPGKFFGSIWLVPLFCFQTPVPQLGEVWLTLLDVGQGLATVVQTQKHILVFDTGAKIGNSFDMGESVVIPFLRTLGANKLDMLVVSHSDNDHIGGAATILKKIPVYLLKTSTPSAFPDQLAHYCLRGDSWEWDQVSFKFIYPTSEHLGFGNDSSCVLQISTGKKSLLLTGDIEKFAEKELVKLESDNLKADILIAPHHGSKTSGEDNFLHKVNPLYVLFPIGYRNRYHFPHKSILEKYQLMGTKMISTVEGGAIKFIITNDGIISEPILYRKEHKHYWNN